MWKPTKKLGQNFLINQSVVGAAIHASNLKKGDIVLEIGPGKGVLTEKLLQNKGISVIAVEKDPFLTDKLREKLEMYTQNGQFTLLNMDIRDFKPQKYLKKGQKFKTVANIPYYLTGFLIREALEAEIKPESMTLLIQKEVAKRIVEADKKSSILSVSVRVFGEVKYIKTVKANSFSPKPKVDSAIIYIFNIQNPFSNKKHQLFFFELLNQGFSSKRKKLIGNLSEKFSKDGLIEIFNKLDINLNFRAENLKTQDWIKLCNELFIHYPQKTK